MPETQISPPVYGIETEYTCMITLPGNVVHEIVGSCHSANVALGLYCEPSSNGVEAIDADDISDALADMNIIHNETGMLSNGGRLYIDPSGPEYATPETTTAEDAVHRSFEGDRILLGIFDRLRKADIITGFQVNRRTVDHTRTSRGVHLNTLTNLTKNELERRRVRTWLATLNIAKGALFGSGGLLLDEDGITAYHHSPRLSVTDTFASSTFTDRPLVRASFKSDGECLARIETITSDALNFGWPLRASLVATNAVVGLIEMDRGDSLPALEQGYAIESAHNVGRYGPEGRMMLEGSDSEPVLASSLHTLRRIAEVALEVNDTEGQLDKESTQVIKEIIDTADSLEADPNTVANQVESIGRLLAMERKMERDNLSLGAERMCRFDYAWDWLAGGIAETLRGRGVGWHGFSALPSPSDTKRRLVTPPSDTRAHVRGKAIATYGKDDCSDWSMIGPSGHHEYLHPLASTTKQQN